MNESKNTARILKGQPLLVTGLMCRFGWHDWTRWGDIIRQINDNGMTRHMQYRSCIQCNRISSKNIPLK